MNVSQSKSRPSAAKARSSWTTAMDHQYDLNRHRGPARRSPTHRLTNLPARLLLLLVVSSLLSGAMAAADGAPGQPNENTTALTVPTSVARRADEKISAMGVDGEQPAAPRPPPRWGSSAPRSITALCENPRYLATRAKQNSALRCSPYQIPTHPYTSPHNRVNKQESPRRPAWGLSRGCTVKRGCYLPLRRWRPYWFQKGGQEL